MKLYVRLFGSPPPGALLLRLPQCLAQPINGLNETLHRALHGVEGGARLRRGWSMRLRRGCGVEVAGEGEFVGVEVVAGVEVEASGPDGALQRGAGAATETGGGGDGEGISHEWA